MTAGDARPAPAAPDPSWDVVVAGAGPAGATAACVAARRGLRTLLVDRAAFPRAKVCGGCLSPAGVRALAQLGLGRALRRAGVPIQSVLVRARGRGATLALAAGGLAIARAALDPMLVAAAADAGAGVRPGTSARLIRIDLNGCDLALTAHETETVVRARVAIAADGLGGSFLRGHAGWEPRVPRGSRIGLGAIVDADLARGRLYPPPGVVSMCCGPGGYVGMVRLADGTIDVAAAVDPSCLRAAATPGEAVGAILRQAWGQAWDEDDAAVFSARVRWHGTPTLTRRRMVERGPVFVVGDAAGSIEPFTGEGMSWAIRGGMALAGHVADRLAGRGRSGDWERCRRRMLAGRHALGAAVARGLRSPRLTAVVAAAASRAPPLGALARGVFAGPWGRRAPAGGAA
ncbi:MAG: FAD-dependent monooxygenase [Phycisphaerae bacterium]|nr:FAD-dependent monooxygenase [Phycisphaerae bacterium]